MADFSLTSSRTTDHPTPRHDDLRLSSPNKYREDQAVAAVSIIHLIVLAVVVIILATPVATILKRVGFSGVNLIALWVLSRVRWPNLPAA